MKCRKEICVFPKPYHSVKIAVEGDSWEEVNKKLMQEYLTLKAELPEDEQKLAEAVLHE